SGQEARVRRTNATLARRGRRTARGGPICAADPDPAPAGTALRPCPSREGPASQSRETGPGCATPARARGGSEPPAACPTAAAGALRQGQRLRPSARHRLQGPCPDSSSEMAASVFRRFARTTLGEGAILDACRQGKKGQRSRRLSKRRTQLRSTRRNAATPRQRHALAPSQHALRCRQATKFCSGVVDVRERVPGALGVAGVDQDLHRARGYAKAPRESPEPDQVL